MLPVYAPTCLNIGIRNANDAFVLLEAVRLGIFPLRRHRLSQAERDNLSPGQVFVWTESSEANGLERWTDGRKWSASRTRDVFLIYEEREEPSVDESVEKAAQRINSFFSTTPTASGDLFGIFAFPRDRPPKLDGLMKQTFSAWVLDPIHGQKVKWHLSAYLSRQGPANLPLVTEDAILSTIQVPNGIYECCTGPRKSRKGSRASGLPPALDQLVTIPGTPSPYASPRQSRRSSRARAEDIITTGQADEPSSPLIYMMNGEDPWDEVTSPTSTLSSTSTSSSAYTPTPPRTISNSSIGSTSVSRSERRLPRILEPYPTPPSSSSFAVSSSSPLHSGSPIGPFPSLHVDTYRVPHMPAHDPDAHLSAIPRSLSLPYIVRSDDDAKTLASFRPF